MATEGFFNGLLDPGREATGELSWPPPARHRAATRANQRINGGTGMTLEGFDEFEFTHDTATRRVYRRGSGPGVVIMHEIPGITPEVAGFARRVADEGFAVYLPHMFGVPNKPLSVP